MCVSMYRLCVSYSRSPVIGPVCISMSAGFFFRNQLNMCRGLGKNRCHHLDHGRLAGNDRKWPHDVIRPRPTKVKIFFFQTYMIYIPIERFFQGEQKSL